MVDWPELVDFFCGQMHKAKQTRLMPVLSLSSQFLRANLQPGIQEACIQ